MPTLPSAESGHYCVVAFVHSAASPLIEKSTDVDEVARHNRQIGQKNVHIGPRLTTDAGGSTGTEAASSDGAVGIGAAMIEYIELHNPTGEARTSSFVLDLRGLPPQIRTSFVLTPLNTARPLKSSVHGVVTADAPVPGSAGAHGLVDVALGWLERLEDELADSAAELLHWVGCWWDNLERYLDNRPAHWCHLRHRLRFESRVYTALPAARVEIADVQLPAHGSAAMLLSVRNRGQLPPGREYTLHVQQVINGRIVGGSAYVVRTEGEPQRMVPFRLERF